MYKPILIASGAILGMAAAKPVARPAQIMPVVHLKEEAMIVEYTASANEAVIKVRAESETGLQRVELCLPDGSTAVKLESAPGHPLAVWGFEFELLEADPVTVLGAYAAGTYDFRGRSVLGNSVVGNVTFSHELPPAPVITYPRNGALHVPANGLTVTWVPDPTAVSYRVGVEQGDRDGLIVELPAGTSSLRVPDGLLRPRTRTFVEVGAVAANGNCTIVEIPFHVE